MKIRFYSLITIALVAFTFRITAGFAGETTGLTSNSIKVGIISDVTGPTSQIQTPLHIGIKTYLQHLSDQGGIHGRKFKVIVEDGRYSVAKDIANFKKLVYSDKIFTLFEIGSTGSGVALVSQVTKEKLPTLMTSTTDYFIKPTRPYHFTEGATYEDEIKILFNYIINVLKVKKPKLALIRADTEHGKVGSRTFNAQLKAYGMKSGGEEVISPGAIEASSQILSLRRSKVTHVILHTTEGNAATFLKEAKRYKFTPMALGTKYACAEDAIRIVKNAANNFVATNSFSSWYDDSPGMKKMRKISLKYYNKDYKYLSYRNYTQGWCQAIIVTEGIKKAGKNLTRAGLVKSMESIKNLDMGGLMANVTYSKTKHQGTAYCRIYKADVKNIKFLPITGYIKAGR
ncbi:MAG: ABC transporter substrate-binding protein [Spirochaetota bacterium]|nr:ABC transporter substrate-binding protein [Spirochaetota bacterium]